MDDAIGLSRLLGGRHAPGTGPPRWGTGASAPDEEHFLQGNRPADEEADGHPGSMARRG
jgi:hypothetical protein